MSCATAAVRSIRISSRSATAAAILSVAVEVRRAECEERGMTYAAPLKVTIRLTVFDKDPESGVKTIRDIKEQESSSVKFR